MAFTPTSGNVIRYDFLWNNEHHKGQIDGAKDRPCAVVLVTAALEDGSRRVMLVPVTHSPPTKDQGENTQRSWIRTHEANVLTWPKDHLPFGLTRARAGTGNSVSCPQHWKTGVCRCTMPALRWRLQTR